MGRSKERNLRAVVKAYGVQGICVSADENNTPEEIAAAGGYEGRDLLLIEAWELRKRGFDVVWEPGSARPAALIVFPAPPTESDWIKLAQTFDKYQSVTNPNYQGPQP